MEVNSVIIQENIEKAKKGDQVAFTFLLDFFWNEVYGFMLKRTENETDTEDIVIETFAKAFDKIESIAHVNAEKDLFSILYKFYSTDF